MFDLGNIHTGLTQCVLSNNIFKKRMDPIFLSCFLLNLLSELSFLLLFPLLCLSTVLFLLPLPAGAGSSSAGIQGSAGYWGRRPGDSHPRELTVTKGHCGQPRAAEGAELLPASWGSWDLFPQRQGRETHHGTRLFPFSGESRCSFIPPCSVPWSFVLSLFFGLISLYSFMHLIVLPKV